MDKIKDDGICGTEVPCESINCARHPKITKLICRNCKKQKKMFQNNIDFQIHFCDTKGCFSEGILHIISKSK